MTLKPSKTIEETIKNFCDEYKIIERSFETCWLNDGFKVYEYYHCKNGINLYLYHISGQDASLCGSCTNLKCL